MKLRNFLITFLAVFVISGCADDPALPGNTPDVVTCGAWVQIDPQSNQCLWTRVCNFDGRRCVNIFECGQRSWDCQ